MGNLFWGFGVIASCFEGGRAEVGGGSSTGSKSGPGGLGDLLGALDLDSFVMEGERAEDLIGRTVLAERMMTSKVPEDLNIRDLRPFAISFEEVCEI